AGLQGTTAYTRIIKYDMAIRKPIAEYAYRLEPVAHPATPTNAFMVNGVTDILSIAENTLLVIERSYSTGKKASTIRVYSTDLSNASNILNTESLIQNPAKNIALKKLLINMDSLGIYIDNIEGVTFGPELPNGNKTLIFVSDNNFSRDQKTQFILFEVVN
ncbi:MAG: esterase-like activity of phytase family protein, partial [Chitinophagaceae bacterium]